MTVSPRVRMRPGRRFWRRASGVVLGLMVVGIGIWLTRRGAHSREIAAGSEPAAREVAAPTVEVVRPKLGGIERTIQQPASLHAFETVNLYAMVSGYLKTQSVNIGSRIKKGEVLAEINVPRDAKMVEEAVALVEQARAHIAQAEVQIQVAEAERDAVEAAARQAESDVDRLKAARVLAEKQLARATGLAEQRAFDQRLVDEQQSVLDAARAAERTAGIAVQTAKARRWPPRPRSPRPRPTRSRPGRCLGVAEASRDRLKVNLQYAKIVAPFDGVVTHRTFHPAP